MIFLALSENDKRVLFALLIAIFLIFVLCGYLGFLARRVLRSQGKKLDYYIADPVTTKVIATQKHFVRYAKKKNRFIFFKRAKVSFFLILLSTLCLVINNIFIGWNYNPFSDTEKGFSSLLFLWDFQDPASWTQFFGTPIYLFTSWPPMIHTPVFHWSSFGVYLFVIGIVFSGIFYLHQVIAYMARWIRIHQLKSTVFSKNLDGFTQLNVIQPQMQQVPQAPTTPDQNKTA